MLAKNQLLSYWKAKKIIKAEQLFQAFLAIKREDFVLPEYRHQAYEDTPLPLGHGATISQPTTVMLMLQALKPKQGDNILEIGTGSGYNAALLSYLVGIKGKVTTIEYVKELFDYASERLKDFKNVKVIYGDGKYGYKQKYLYNKIIVTAASDDIPQALIEQLRVNGTLVMPIGPFHNQQVFKIKKTKKELKRKSIGNFIFVPLK
ncbi:MAG TPA: protein-L-isoaspartate(D-aspartate) O-methyltransferase [Candidatus Nanoarchaeia archaeon]|nr:protein-L-isoaspartate(D-aspartate) O-methyltransferase [Candidatus Nanoarchaeia archaeon]